MLDILGKKYYIDVDKVIEQCRPVYVLKKQNENEDEVPEGGLELNVFKFEIFKSCLERVLNEYPDDKDDDIPVFQEKSTSMSFRVAFNTLKKYEIIIEDDNE